MYIEKRRQGNNIKYYLVHSYREKNRVKKIRRYLGMNLTSEELKKQKVEAKKLILSKIEELSTQVFLFKLTKKQVELMNNYNDKLIIRHFDPVEWRRFTEEFVYNTNAIEGLTVERGEVPEILQKKVTSDPEEIETKGVAEAVNYIKGIKKELTLELIKKLHKLCFKGSKIFAGEFRKVDVVIKNSRGEIIHVGTPKEQVIYALKDLIKWYNNNKQKFKPLILAAIIHNQFEHIHPFQDGNGRVGRLLLNYILIKNNYPPINIQLEDRGEYYQALQEYSRRGNLKPTLQLLVKQYKKTLGKVTTKEQDK